MASNNQTSSANDAATAVAFLFENSRFSGALFNNAGRKEGSPLMTGSMTIDSQQVGLSAFMKTPGGDKREYLSLSLGDKDGVHYYGKLFRSEPGRSANAPHYSGFITVLPCDGATQYTDDEWEAAPQLQVCGWRERNAGGGARIALEVASRTVEEGELAF